MTSPHDIPRASTARHSALPGAYPPVPRRRPRGLGQALDAFRGPESIRPRTLIALRWVALAGQASAVSVAWLVGARFPLVAVVAVIALSALVNLALWQLDRQRPSECETLGQLLFDVVQIGLLLTLTGGISNPFALFVLVPLTIGATVLPRPAVLAAAGMTGLMVLMMAILPVPLRLPERAAVDPLLAIRAGHFLSLTIGGAFLALYVHRVSAELAATTDALAATRMGLAREQQLQHLGGVVAAAAHEMGTPLATIKLVASELADEFADDPEIAGDLALLRGSVDRCRDILRSMGSAGKDDLLLRAAPLEDVLAEAAAPHRDRDKLVEIDGDSALSLIVRRDAGLIHGLRNLIQNAVDFAGARVSVRAERTGGEITVTIHDDGPGYPAGLVARLGEPFLTARRGGSDRAYEGMGLGVFIARTLLERSGGRIAFFNRGGAVARITWPETALIADDRAALGANPAITD